MIPKGQYLRLSAIRNNILKLQGVAELSSDLDALMPKLDEILIDISALRKDRRITYLEGKKQLIDAELTALQAIEVVEPVVEVIPK
jgi:hypothetical protein